VCRAARAGGPPVRGGPCAAARARTGGGASARRECGNWRISGAHYEGFARAV